MYISREMHDALCEAGVWAIILMFGTMALAIGVPWLWRWTRLYMIKLKIIYLRIVIAYCDIMLWVSHLVDRMIIAVHRRQEKRRYKAAMRVFDKPVRWEEK